MVHANKAIKVGVVGATGMVGKSFIATLNQRKFPIAELRPFASDASVGKQLTVQGKNYSVQSLTPGCFDGLDLVFFSSGDDISAKWAPLAVQAGAWAVDNSAAFRMDPKTLLIVPEVNGHLLREHKTPQIIANPNCSTIQLVVALKPLANLFGIESVKVSSYQAVSGGGQAAHDELDGYLRSYPEGAAWKKEGSVFPKPIGLNCIPEIGGYKHDGYFSEELKIIQETKKILELPNLRVSAFCVRVPVFNSHAETVWVTLKSEVSEPVFRQAMKEFPGLVTQDDPTQSRYPIQSEVSGLDPVYVGRIHRDLEDPKTWLFWVVSDNIRKGAALNGLQIAERIFDITPEA